MLQLVHGSAEFAFIPIIPALAPLGRTDAGNGGSIHNQFSRLPQCQKNYSNCPLIASNCWRSTLWLAGPHLRPGYRGLRFPEAHTGHKKCGKAAGKMSFPTGGYIPLEGRSDIPLEGRVSDRIEGICFGEFAPKVG